MVEKPFNFTQEGLKRTARELQKSYQAQGAKNVEVSGPRMNDAGFITELSGNFSSVAEMRLDVPNPKLYSEALFAHEPVQLKVIVIYDQTGKEVGRHSTFQTTVHDKRTDGDPAPAMTGTMMEVTEYTGDGYSFNYLTENGAQTYAVPKYDQDGNLQPKEKFAGELKQEGTLTKVAKRVSAVHGYSISNPTTTNLLVKLT